MERRGEGFERERYVPEPGPEVRREGVERERIVEPAARERVTEPVVREEHYGVAEPGLGMRPYDLARWGPVFAGVFVSLSLIVLLGVLGAALGFGLAGPATAPNVAANLGNAAMIWGALTLIVAFFAGGWVAARLTSTATPEIGLIHGVAVWGVTIVGLLLLGAIGVAGLVGTITGPGAPAVPGTPGTNMGLAQGAAWGTFIALALGLAAAAIGGYFGGQYFETHHHRRPLIR
jgi:hypothetical protein